MSPSRASWVRQVERTVDFPAATEAQEALLRAGAPAVYAGVVGRAGVSYGVGVGPEATYLRRAIAEGVSIHPRNSGGTGIVHLPGDLVWALVLPRADPRIAHGFVQAYPSLGAGVAGLLRSRGHTADWVAAPGLWDPYCPLSGRGSVLTLDGRIVGAAAQHATPGALLHQGLLSVTLDRWLIARVFELPQPEWADRLVSLDEVGVSFTPEELAEGIVAGVERADGTA